ADSAGVDQNTATGITTLAGAASRLLQFKAGKIQAGIWQRTFEQWGSLIQQYMDKPQWVRITGPGNELSFEVIHPQDVVGDYDFILMGTEESLSQQQERTEAMALLNALAPYVQLGVVNPQPLIEKAAIAFGFITPEELVAKHPPMPIAAPGQPGPAGPPPVTANGQQPPPGPPGAAGNPAMSPDMLQQLFQPRVR